MQAAIKAAAAAKEKAQVHSLRILGTRQKTSKAQQSTKNILYLSQRKIERHSAQKIEADDSCKTRPSRMALQLRYRSHSVSEDEMNHSGSSHRFRSVAEGRASFYTTFGDNFCISNVVFPAFWSHGCRCDAGAVGASAMQGTQSQGEERKRREAMPLLDELEASGATAFCCFVLRSTHPRKEKCQRM